MQLYGGMEYHVHFSARRAAFAAVQVTTAVRISCFVSCFSFLCSAAITIIVGVFCGLSFPVVCRLL